MKALTVILIDIDHFKLYNDTYGHQQNDACLRTVADTLAECAGRRGEDVVARYGGEEFVLLLPGTDQDGGRAVGEAVRRAVVDRDIPHGSSPTAAHVTLSLGVSAVTPGSGLSSEQLVQLADEALYRAKGAGRNQVVAALGAVANRLELLAAS